MRIERPWALPLVPAYWAGLRLKDALGAVGVLPVRTLSWPVISIGSLSVGGAGKTPAVIAFAELLHEHGWSPDVLSRGYARRGTGVERVNLDDLDPARRFGDEPVLIAQRSRVPVWVGASRFHAGIAAEAALCPANGLHLLDDGFQHRQLARNLDVLLITRQDLDDMLLPAGNLREPRTALARADAVVVRENEYHGVEAQLRTLLQAPKPLWVLRRTLRIPVALAQSGQPVIAFCGIGRPEGFFTMLSAQGVRVASRITFSDHHRYTLRDVPRLVESCHLENGGGFVTTEKDAVKIGAEMRAALESAGPLHVARLEAALTRPEDVFRVLEARLR